MVFDPPITPLELADAMSEMRFERCLELEIKPIEEELTPGYLIGTINRALRSGRIDPKRTQDLLTLFARYLQEPGNEKKGFPLRIFLTQSVIERLAHEEAKEGEEAAW